MKELTLGPGEILYKKDQIDTRYYFLNSGNLEIFFERRKNY